MQIVKLAVGSFGATVLPYGLVIIFVDRMLGAAVIAFGIGCIIFWSLPSKKR
jgi:hypothetical protein